MSLKLFLLFPMCLFFVNCPKPLVPLSENAPLVELLFIEHLKSLKEYPAKAWAMYSYSGWGDAGHLLVIKSKTLAQAVLVRKNDTTPTLKTVKIAYLDQKKWNNLKKTLDKIEMLKTVDSKAFDSLTFEIISIEIPENNVFVMKRVYINDPLCAYKQKHCQIIRVLSKFLRDYLK